MSRLPRCLANCTAKLAQSHASLNIPLIVTLVVLVSKFENDRDEDEDEDEDEDDIVEP